jgi:hypothetical protein
MESITIFSKCIINDHLLFYFSNSNDTNHFQNSLLRLSRTRNQKYICFCKSVKRRRHISSSR